MLRTLTPTERSWTKYHSLLEAQGYTLRARYQPDWIPMCLTDPTKHPGMCEDLLTPISRTCLDATRTRDGTPAMLKWVELWTESHIATFLNLIRDPHNHTIPVMDVIHLPDDPTRRILVTPRMSMVDQPPFGTIGEVLEFLQQFFEGVEFMHRYNVAHCDIALRNMVMDSTQLIPGGFHPIFTWTQDGISKNTVILTRTQVAPVRYYFIDFGLSVIYPTFDARGKVTGIVGKHRDIPELSDDIPYDPFKLDIRQMGETIKKDFLNKYWNLDFLIPLNNLLRRDNPAKRPDAAEALRELSRVQILCSLDNDALPTPTPTEQSWTNYYDLLESRGYTLEPQYKPDRTPMRCLSNPSKELEMRQDTVAPAWRTCVDAIRRRDGARVIVKCVELISENDIALGLSQKDDDPHRRSIPVLASIIVPDDEPIRHLLVMPKLHPMVDRSPFVTVGEVLDFLEQFFHGVEFIHRNNVAHCNIALSNIVAVPTAIIPGAISENGISNKPDTWTGVHYFFIDFGLSVLARKPAEVIGILGEHRDIPELSDDIPYDAFKLDIRQMGETIKHDFLNKYWNLNFLIPLNKLLRRDDPKLRPDAGEALRRFRKIADRIDGHGRAVPLVSRTGFHLRHRVGRALSVLRHLVVSRISAFKTRKEPSPSAGPWVQVPQGFSA
ncbi:hypothetical protein C8R46DRAFT_895444 [Mycena filopes]|nr:hypothetical protein C8R46DRAFT_895444 [Mycena filopes]